MNDLLETPWLVRRGADLLAVLVPLVLLGMALLPWQQSAVGSGQVFNWDPADRVQAIEAPISGRLAAWEVGEGEHVTEGQLLARVVDNDPERLGRVERQAAAAQESFEALRARIESARAGLAAEEARVALSIAEAEARVAEEERERVGELAELETARLQATRVAALLEEGLASQRERELADLTVAKAQAALAARDATLAAARTARSRVEAEGTAKIASATLYVRDAEAKAADAEIDALEAASRLARQGTQDVRAPRDGIILSLVDAPGGTQVSAGERLAEIVPAADARAVELTVDGRDVVLIQPDQPVRLLFEGWPALQVAGIPGASTGTYAGRVSFVDAADDGSGHFRVVVAPDPASEPWPDAALLRRGVRAKGFFLLGRVPLGFELWRQVHGFPPSPRIQKGTGVTPPTTKKPRIPGALK